MPSGSRPSRRLGEQGAEQHSQIRGCNTPATSVEAAGQLQEQPFGQSEDFLALIG